MLKKQYKYRLDTNSNILIKEGLQTIYRGDNSTVTMNVGIGKNDSGNECIIEPNIVRDGVAIKLSDALNNCESETEKLDLSNKVNDFTIPTYIKLNEVNYLANAKLEYDGEELKSINVNFYIPMECKDLDSISCISVDETLTEDIKEELKNSIKDYIIERLNTQVQSN